MERKEFYESCERLSDFRMPRWDELPEIDLYMDQVIAIAEKYLRPIAADGENLLTQAMINNYVKNKIVPPPQKKRYAREQIARILIICALKHVAGISSISEMINSLLQVKPMSEVLNEFAEKFERELDAKREYALSAADKNESAELSLMNIAMENAIKANSSRLISEFAYGAVCARKQREEEERRLAEQQAEEQKRNAEKAQRESARAAKATKPKAAEEKASEE